MSPRRWILLSFWLSAAGACLAANPQTAAQFEEASKAYQAGDFSKAREIFEGLANSDKRNPDLGYNLGNTYYRLGKTGRSILWYERALRERPFDGDLNDNLAIARAGLKNEERTFFEKIISFPAITWLLGAAAACLWIGFGALTLLFLGKPGAARFLKRTAVLFTFLWVFFAGWAALRWWDESKPWGISVEPDIQVRSGPGTGFAVGATAPEGLKVLILGERDGWTLVGLPAAGIKGWTQSANVEPIE